jgi:ferrous iron transport protein B
MRDLKILFVGQPNVGKSSLLNALVGPRVTVSNYPGTTVEITKAKKRFNKINIEFVDTPGIYSISDRSEEERVTERALFEEETDGVVVIADATSLERSLYMAFQILEAQIPTVIALNFVEDAEKKGIRIDCGKLKGLLRIPVVPINPLTKMGVDELVDTITKIKKAPEGFFTVEYDDHIESALDKISSQVKGTPMPERFVSLRALEGDEDFYKYLKDDRIIRGVKRSLKEHPEVAEDIAITRYGTAAFIAERTIQLMPASEKEENLQERIDRLLLHRISGPLVTGLFLLAMLGILLYLGNLIQGVLTGLTENLTSSLFIAEHSFLTNILASSLTGLAMGVSIALPYVFLFYLFLGLLEDTGLLSRFTVNAEWFLRKIGLPGKSFIPLALGLGCTAPAARSTRVLSSEREQFHTASLFAFIPCSSRIAIIMGIVGFYGDTRLALSVFATSFAAGLVWAFGIKRVIQIETEPLLLELPPYRKPLIKNVLAKSWIRMKDFVYVVIPLLVLGGMAYGILDMSGLTETIVEPLAPITTWLGLPNVTIIPIIFGFLQKDLTGAMLLSVLGVEIPLALTPIQIYTFGVATTLGIPCMIALGMLIKEFGFSRAIVLTVTSIAYGLLFAGLAWRIVSVFQ